MDGIDFSEWNYKLSYFSEPEKKLPKGYRHSDSEDTESEESESEEEEPRGRGRPKASSKSKYLLN